MTQSTRREDLLVSVCFPDFHGGAEECDKLSNLVPEINRHFRYWELVAVIDSAPPNAVQELLTKCTSLRVIRTHPSLSFYRRRLLTASEAIGDVVLLTDFNEVAFVDIVAMIGSASATGGIVIAEHEIGSLLNPFLQMLGRSGGLKVDVRISRTAAYSRPVLNELLRRRDRELALRFPPIDPRWKVEWHSVASKHAYVACHSEWRRRSGIIYSLMVNSAPLALRIVALLSAGVSLIGLAYMAYAVVAYMVLSKVQPGWLTTSLLLGITATFIGISTFGLSAGLHKAIDLMTDDVGNDVVEEHSGAGLLSQVKEELNVEIHGVPYEPNRLRDMPKT